MTDNRMQHDLPEEVALLLWAEALAHFEDFPCIGHVRGVGLFVAFALVDASNQKPAPGTAKHIKEALKARQVLVSIDASDGHHSQVMKIKPPLCFSNVDTLITSLVDLLKPGVPVAVRQIDRAYDPSQKTKRIQNTTWQAEG
ncbi:MAG: Alanine--glyoxylate aminotransferase 2-like 1 [Trebouxia sp. A1-2]|nr:MAG: Alanine--glyoxylate aminotransferase 2-like 1 [Trebouxia sp. A1-2]